MQTSCIAVRVCAQWGPNEWGFSSKLKSPFVEYCSYQQLNHSRLRPQTWIFISKPPKTKVFCSAFTLLLTPNQKFSMLTVRVYQRLRYHTFLKKYKLRILFERTSSQFDIFLIVRVLLFDDSLLSGSMTNPSGSRDSSKFAMPEALGGLYFCQLERLIALEGLFYEVKSEM